MGLSGSGKTTFASRHVVLRQVLPRSVRRALDRKPVLNGNYETFARWHLPGHPIQLVLRHYHRKKQQFADALGAPEHAHLKVVRCSSWWMADQVLDHLVEQNKKLRGSLPTWVDSLS